MTRAGKVLALALSCCIFLVIGINSSMLGPVLPDLAKQTGNTLAVTGSVITALFLGALIIQFLLGPVNDRVGPRRVLVVALALAACGLVVVSVSPSLPQALVGMFVLGTGIGAMIVSTNVMLTVVFASRSVAALNFSNVFYGVGAICGPVLSSLLAQRWGSTLPIMWVEAGLLALLWPATLMLRTMKDQRRETKDERKSINPPSLVAGRSVSKARLSQSVYRAPALWVLGGVLLIYVGAEAGAGSWAITYLNRSAALRLDEAAFLVSGFWLALTSGRLLGAIVGVWLSARSLLTVSFVGATAGTLVLLLSGGSAPVMAAGLLLFGFSLGPVYPTVVSVATTTFVEAPGKAAGFVMAVGSIGGMIIPWLLGVVLEWGGTYASIGVLAACVAAMLALHVGPQLARGRATVDAVGNL
jgi:fucose permease